MAVSAAVLIALSMATVITLATLLMQQNSRTEAEAHGRALLGEYAATIGQELNMVAAMVATGVATVEGVIAGPSVDRDLLGNLTQQFLRSRPDLVGMTLVFEPEAFGDGDARFRDHPLTDENGRFAPYFYFDQRGQIAVELLDMSPEAGTEEWYDRPMRENRTLITPPYIYPVDGQDVLMTTISGVVRRDGRPVGILTADLALSDISARIDQLRPFGDGRVALLGGDDLWVAHHDAARLGVTATDSELGEIGAALSSGAAGQVVRDGVTKLQMVDQVRFEGMSEYWTLIMEVPRATILREVTSTRNLSVLVAGAVLAVTLLLAWLGAQFISRPIQKMTEVVKHLAAGDTNVDIPYRDRADEIGKIASAVAVFRDNALEARRLEAEAEAARQEVDAERAREMARQTRIVREIGDGLDRLASGDLSTQIESPTSNPFPIEYDALRQSYNTALQRLARMMGEVTTAAESVTLASREINSASDELARRAETQAATLEQSSAALSQLAESVRSTATRARAAQGVSRTASENSQQGVADVGRAIEAMRMIETSSQKINQITDVIDGIAFQTNLLALNAGVEAARAGDAGRGFAVVASEVRGLAQRASESAQEIKTLISESAQHVGNGAELVQKAGVSLDSLNDRASELAVYIAEIATAAAEQSSGLDQINSGVADLDAVTQQNAAVAEETTAASTSLASKAEDLRQALAEFTTQMRQRAAA